MSLREAWSLKNWHRFPGVWVLAAMAGYSFSQGKFEKGTVELGACLLVLLVTTGILLFKKKTI